MNHFKRLALAMLMTIMASSSAWALTVDYAYVSSRDYNSYGQAVYNAIGQQTWMFTHASVGGNMLAGMDGLHSGDSTKYQLTTPTASAGAPPAGGLTPGSVYDRNRGNPGWSSKYQIFEDMMNAGWGNAAGFVMDKLCYIDQNADVSVYLDMMARLQVQYPNTTFVYTTMPLRTGGGSTNDLRNAYNEAVRAAMTADTLLFDIADLEAHDSDGNEYTYIAGDGSVYQSLWSGWTSDGGHLNTEGREWVAEGWYQLAASQATPIPGTIVLLGCGLGGLALVRRRAVAEAI